jgi:Tol biopolymer transport system component
MKAKYSILGLVMFFFFCGIGYAQDFETIQIGDGTQNFSRPVWSPNGENLAFWGPGGIYVCKWDGTEQPKKIFDTFGEDLMWASDSELVYWQRKYWEEKQEGQKPKRMERDFIKLVNLDGKEETITEGNNLKAPNKLLDGTVIFTGSRGYEIIREGKLGKDALKKQYGVTSHYPPVYDSRIKGPKYEDTDIWISSLDGSFKKRVTYGKEYYYPILSPDGTKILASDFIVLNLDGNELTNLNPGRQKISNDIHIGACCSEWSPDSKRIVYISEMDNDSTQQIIGADLYIVNIDGSGRTQITNTPNEIELDPEWSPDGTKIACWSENTNKIFVVKLK